VLFDEGVKLAEQNQLTEAIDCFSQAIALNPDLPSAYNNRAQAYQLKNQTNGTSPIAGLFLIFALLEAMSDLDTAIDLATDVQQHRKTLSLALTQRGTLRRFLGVKKATLPLSAFIATS
jgi:tetratricopeptide (TPR) repeat protein